MRRRRDAMVKLLYCYIVNLSINNKTMNKLKLNESFKMKVIWN